MGRPWGDISIQFYHVWVTQDAIGVTYRSGTLNLFDLCDDPLIRQLQ
jgi:hypothetical protein